jgi:ElaB/YqjD/DUF883 family membrane-anchored ribosome-binding protein
MITQLTASHGAVEGNKEQLVQDLKSVVTDADLLLKEMAASTVDRAATTRAKVERKLGEARSRLGEARIAVTEKAKAVADTSHEYARENPWKILGISAAAGLIIGFLLTRR